MKSIIPILVLLIIKGVNWSKFPWYGYAAALVLFTLPIILYGWFKWRKFSYTLQDDRIVLRQGIFVREEKSIYFSRIHSIQTQQPLIQRLLRLAQLKIETPGGSKEADGVLPALAVAEAERIEQWLYQKRNEAVKKAEAPLPAEHAEDLNSDEEGESPEQKEKHIQASATLMQPEREVLLRLSAGRLFAGALTTMNLPLVVVFGTGFIPSRMICSLRTSTAAWLSGLDSCRRSGGSDLFLSCFAGLDLVCCPVHDKVCRIHSGAGRR